MEQDKPIKYQIMDQLAMKMGPEERMVLALVAMKNGNKEKAEALMKGMPQNKGER